MIKFFAAVTCAGLAASAALADGHKIVVDPSFQHGHVENVANVTHTHVVNGVTVTHTHKPVETAAQAEGVFRSRYQVGAGFGPYSVAEYQARVAAGQPGLVRRQEPWPTRPYRNQ